MFRITVLLLTLAIPFTSIADTFAAKEWCPRHRGQFPAWVVDLGANKMFYFAASVSNPNWQNAIVYHTKNKKVISVSAAKGKSDWFSSISYEGGTSGFSCDAVTFIFESAWILDGNGNRKNFTQGKIRSSESQPSKLTCTTDSQE
jgi:hypothetical protein